MAAVLVGVGLFLELTTARVTVVAVQQAADSSPAAPDDDAADIAPGLAAAPGASASYQAPIALASPARTSQPVAALQVTATPTLLPPEPSPTSAIAASPVPVAAASPSPVVARARTTPGPRGAPRASADLPIVMYHHIGPLPPNPDVFRRDLTVSPELFEKTLDYIAENDIQTVTMADLFEHFAGGTPLPKKAIILTFDDGYDDNYIYAFQALKARGMVGTFFISTDFTEHPEYMTWDQVAEMSAAGMEIAAHSTNHADFTTLSAKELRRQLVEPKTELEKCTGIPVRFMAYPAGKYNATVMAATRAAGYEAAVTVKHGTHHTPAGAFELPRVRAHGADTLAQITSRFTPAAWR